MPTYISDELAEFIGKPLGTKMTKMDASKIIREYIKQNNLQDPIEPQTIRPDAKLSKLLKCDQTDKQLTLFNLQIFLKPHFLIQRPTIETACKKRNYDEAFVEHERLVYHSFSKL